MCNKDSESGKSFAIEDGKKYVFRMEGLESPQTTPYFPNGVS